MQCGFLQIHPSDPPTTERSKNLYSLYSRHPVTPLEREQQFIKSAKGTYLATLCILKFYQLIRHCKNQLGSLYQVQMYHAVKKKKPVRHHLPTEVYQCRELNKSFMQFSSYLVYNKIAMPSISAILEKKGQLRGELLSPSLLT